MSKQYTTLSFDITPSHYSLCLEPDFKSFHFAGRVAIDLHLQKSTRSIKLHAKELEVSKAVLVQGEKEYPAAIKLNPDKEELILTLPAAVKGNAEIVLHFIGILNDKMYGFYRSRYAYHRREEVLLSSQFEAANARAAFPCFDEPAFKAAFDVTLIVPKKLLAISNMPVQEEQLISAGRKRVHFQRTLIMSTYLLYLGVGNFAVQETKHRNVQLRVLTTPDKKKYAALPLQYSKTFLQFFERYFAIPYPLPKLDLIAIPDFASGAMENWGAITFREIALLGDEKTSVIIKQNIAITIAHELAHQWFGNLVTMQWWDDLWLNESFATFMSYKVVDAAFPDWDLPQQYFEDTIMDALSADQMKTTHPINVHVRTPGEIDEIFDRISYDKGGSVLHMLEDFVGKDAFQKGLSYYLRKYSYKNASKDNLWEALAKVSKNRLLPQMMQSWIIQPGYPLIKMKSTPKGYELSQQRFTLIGGKYKEQWLVPIIYKSKAGSRSIMLKGKSLTLPDAQEIKIPIAAELRGIFNLDKVNLSSVAEQRGIGPSQEIKLNYGQNGFYRVQYDAAALAVLGEHILGKKLSALDAAGIENDLYALLVAGEYTVKEYLAFVQRYCLDADYPLNSRVSAHINWLYHLLAKYGIDDEIKKVSLEFHGRLLQKVSWQRREGEKNTTTLLRSIAITSLGLLHDAVVLQEAAERFALIQRGKEVDANLRGAVYALAAWQGDERTYKYLLQRYRQEKVPEENRKLLRSLGVFQSPALLKKSLALSQSSAVRLQDAILLPMAVAGNPAAEEKLIWNWTKQNWHKLQQRFSSGTHMLPYLVQNVGGASSPQLLQEVRAFFMQKKNMRDDIKQAVKQTLERIEVNVRFVERNVFKN